MPTERAAANGLEGVLVADTLLSDVDGERGRLVLAGEDVESAAGRVSFEWICQRFWSAAGLEGLTESQVQRALGDGRVLAHGQLERLGSALSAPDGMDALRAALAQLFDAPTHGLAAAARVTGMAATFVAAWARRRSGGPTVAPDPDRGHAEDYLRMVSGTSPSPAATAALNAYLVTVIDHGMNASTFAARVVASTGSDLVSSVTAAVGALKGPLHGGAPGPVLEMLAAIGKPDRARAWIEAELNAGRRIMGMGHRVYRTRDPRAAVLERAVERLQQGGGGDHPTLALARSVEKEAEALLKARHPERALRANVEFYTATLLDALGLPAALFSPTFAVSRIAGWTAHVFEQRRTGRLIRPASRYVGPAPA